jgi:hypothetical protein
MNITRKFNLLHNDEKTNNQPPWLLVRERTTPPDRQPLVGEVSANYCREGYRVVSAADPQGRNLGFQNRT